MFVIGGVVLVQFHNSSNYSSHFEKHIEANAIYYGKLSEPVRLKKNTVQCKVSICKIFKNDTVKSLQKRILNQEHKIYPKALKMILN